MSAKLIGEEVRRRTAGPLGTIDKSQRKAAKVVGFTYLFAMATAVFADSYVRRRLIIPDNAAETAQKIMAHEQLWRIGIASNLLCYATDIALIAALYVVLRQVNDNLARFAVFVRLVETSVFVVITLHDFDVLKILSGADYLRVLEASRLPALALLSVTAYGDRYNAGLVIFGLGSAMFSYLWFKSGYVPRVLAAWGVFSSLLVATGSFALIVFPGLEKVLLPGYYVPIFIFEVVMGFWLLLKGLRPSGAVESNRQSKASRVAV